ncbi:MAG TPA: DMT family transporter [Xanthobacteraceae bacterium]|nr:DMT family transporter [Xanthobacteraceae bacterium]
MTAETRRAGLFGNAYLVLALASLCWSGNHLMGRAIAGHVPPMAITTLRWLLAAAILAPFAWPHLKRDWPTIRAHIGVLAYLSLTGGALFGALQFVGLQLTTALNVSVMNSLGPVTIGAASAVMFRDRLTGGQFAGILVSLVGVLAIITQLDPGVLTHLSFNIGDVIILINMAIWGVYSASLRWRPAIHPLSFMVMFSLISGVAMLPVWAWEHSTGYVLQPTLLTFAAIPFVTVFSTIAAFMFWARGVELIGANRAGVFLHLIPVYSALLTGVLLGEPLRSYHVVGFVLILLGVWCASRR